MRVCLINFSDADLEKVRNYFPGIYITSDEYEPCDLYLLGHNSDIYDAIRLIRRRAPNYLQEYIEDDSE